MTTQWRCEKTGDPVQDRNNSILLDIISALSSKVKSLTDSKVQAISVEQVRQLLNPQNLVKHFQASGDAPLNVTGLAGVLGTAQIAGIPILAAVPTPNDPKFVNTAAVVVSGVLFVNDNGSFVGTTVGITAFTLSGGTTGLTGGSLTTPGGTITLAGTLAIANGGTGGVTAAAARSNLGIDPIATKLSNLSATVAPTVNDDSGDGFSIGSLWIDTTADNIYMATDTTVGAAIWRQLN